MKMQKLTIEFVSFDSEDVISTSGPTIYTFNGLGNDKTGLYGRDLSITKGGADVTDTYIYEGSQYGVSTNPSATKISLNTAGSAYLDIAWTSEGLANNGITDGNYVLDSENGGTYDNKFVPYSGN